MSETSKIRTLVFISLYAALYAILSLLTAWIPTGPYFIQFRPGVVVPMIAAVMLQPWAAGLSAAIGTFIASIIRYGTPLLTIFSGTPGNFLGFYVMGLSYSYLRKKKINWIVSLAVSSVIGMVVGAVVIALGLWFLANTFMPSLGNFTNIVFSITSSFILVLAPLPIAFIICIAALKLLEKAKYLSL
ncbi:MAG: ECF transporter S component [Thermoproteota archaeon]